MSTAEPVSVTVKPLEWTQPQGPNDTCSYDHVQATGVWFYSIEWKSWKNHDYFTVYRDENFLSAENDLEAAKAAAQADYETRILTALSHVQAPAAADVQYWKDKYDEAEHALQEAYKELDEVHTYIAEHKLYTHPTPQIDDAMVERAVRVWMDNCHRSTHDAMTAALEAAIGGKPEPVDIGEQSHG
jgi:hypothetical protein